MSGAIGLAEAIIAHHRPSKIRIVLDHRKRVDNQPLNTYPPVDIDGQHPIHACTVPGTIELERARLGHSGLFVLGRWIGRYKESKMANQLRGTAADAIAAHKREKQALIRASFDHCRNAPANHTAFCCQWCTDNGDAQIALDNEMGELTRRV